MPVPSFSCCASVFKKLIPEQTSIVLIGLKSVGHFFQFVGIRTVTSDTSLNEFRQWRTLHARHTVVRSQPEVNSKRTNLAADGEERNEHTIGESGRRHAPEKANRATAALPQACSGNLETNPERAREEPRRALHATGPVVQRDWLFWDVDVGNALSATCKDTRGNAGEGRARRLRPMLLALLAPQGEAHSGRIILRPTDFEEKTSVLLLFVLIETCTVFSRMFICCWKFVCLKLVFFCCDFLVFRYRSFLSSQCFRQYSSVL